MHRPGVPREAVEAAIAGAFEAFKTGSPEVVFKAVEALASMTTQVADEAARLRFRVNFSTPVCESCDGLRAGPDVLATCYERRACHYSNVKVGDSDPHRRRLLRLLVDES